MTRAEIETQYNVIGGWIHSPGQFEGKPVFAPHFWAATLDGCCEELEFMSDGCGEYVALVEVDDDDRREYPELGTAAFVCICQSDNGFIDCEPMSEARADNLRKAYAKIS